MVRLKAVTGKLQKALTKTEKFLLIFVKSEMDEYQHINDSGGDDSLPFFCLRKNTIDKTK